MTISKNFVFLSNASSPGSSNDFSEFSADQLTIEVSGTATSFSLKVCMYIDDRSNRYTDLALVDLSEMSVVTRITKPGLYTCGIAGTTGIKVILESVSGGYVNVFGRSIAN